MTRNTKDAQPGRKLSEAEWEALWLDYTQRRETPVSELCRDRGVSRARFYQRFSDRIGKKNAPAADTDEG